MDAAQQNSRQIDPLERETIKRVAWRLVPVLVLGYFAAYLDRVNVGMAAPTMMPDMHFTSAIFGFGAGLFFVGYTAAEIPSNLILNHIGARRWIARILITWGILSALTALVWNDWSFYIVRFLLGLAEAGYFPGVMLYLTWWFPSYYRSRMVAVFYSASTVSLVIGPPIGGLLLLANGWLGLHGWQWLFIFEALPAVIMSFVTWRLLTDRPDQALWLRPEQRAWLSERLATERARKEAIRKYSLGEIFYDSKVWLLTIAGFGNSAGIYGTVIFLPLVVKGLGVSTNMIGVVSALPYVFAFVAMLYWGWHSDRTGERVWHAAGAWLLCAAGLSAGVLIGVGHPVVTMIALIFAAIGQASCFGVYWALPTALLTGTAAAGGFAFMNGVASLGGFFGPWMVGWVRGATGSDAIALLCLAGAPVISAIAVLTVGHDRRLEGTSTRP